MLQRGGDFLAVTILSRGTGLIFDRTHLQIAEQIRPDLNQIHFADHTQPIGSEFNRPEMNRLGLIGTAAGIRSRAGTLIHPFMPL
jgi:hypothetical protein